MGIPWRNDASWWMVDEFNATLENNIVPGTRVASAPFELVSGRASFSMLGPRPGATLLICPNIVSEKEPPGKLYFKSYTISYTTMLISQLVLVPEVILLLENLHIFGLIAVRPTSSF